MKPALARTMTWASALLLLLGGMVGAPEAGVAAAALAGLAALAPLLSPGARWRTVGALLLAAALWLGASLWPEAAAQQARYRARAAPAAAPAAPSAP